MIDLEIPDFLRVSREDRKETKYDPSWIGRKVTKVKPGSVKVTRNEGAQTRAFRREMERQAKEKQRLRLQALREKHR